MSTIPIVIFYTALCIFTFALSRKKTWLATLNDLRLNPIKANVGKTALHAIALFFIIFSLLTLEALVLSIFNLDDSDKVSLVISNLTLPAIIVAATLGPFAEELFFRGFLQKHTGVILSSVAFGLLHFSFGSIVEILGAFTASAVLGYWVKYRNPSLWPAIIAHAGYNLASILLVMVVTA